MHYLTFLFAAIGLVVLSILPPTMLPVLAASVATVCLCFGLTLLLRDRIAESSAPPLEHQATWLRNPVLMTLTLLALICAMMRGGLDLAVTGLSRLFRLSPAPANAL